MAMSGVMCAEKGRERGGTECLSVYLFLSVQKYV